MQTILVLGHSFIARLQDFMDSNSELRNMNFDPQGKMVFLRGFRGGKVKQIKDFGLRTVQQLRPDIVLLQIGSNDLCNPELSVRDVAKNIIEIVLILIFMHGVTKVGVMQILHRVPPKRLVKYAIDTAWFNDRCDTLNKFLDDYFAHDNVPGARFWRHSGFWSPKCQSEVYDSDGVHLNNTGYIKYYRSVRALMVTASRF